MHKRTWACIKPDGDGCDRECVIEYSTYEILKADHEIVLESHRKQCRINDQAWEKNKKLTEALEFVHEHLESMEGYSLVSGARHQIREELHEKYYGNSKTTAHEEKK